MKSTYPSPHPSAITIQRRCTPQTRPALATTLPRLVVVPIALEIITVVIREVQDTTPVIERSDEKCVWVSCDPVINGNSSALGQSVCPHVILIVVYTAGLDSVV